MLVVANDYKIAKRQRNYISMQEPKVCSCKLLQNCKKSTELHKYAGAKWTSSLLVTAVKLLLTFLL